MNDQTKLTAKYDALDKIIKIVLQIIIGGLVSGLYRVIRYTETKNNTTLIVGIVCLITPLGFVAQIVDLVTTITQNKFVYFID